MIYKQITIVSAVVFGCIFIFSLHSYIVESRNYQELYGGDFLSTNIDISKAGEEYGFKFKNSIPSDTYSVNISIPALCADQETNDWREDYRRMLEITKTLLFKLEVILKCENQVIFDKTFDVQKNANAPIFFERYSYKKGQNPWFNLIVKVVEPEIKEKFAQAHIRVFAFCKGSDAGIIGAKYLMVLSGVLFFISLLLNFVLKSKI